MFRKNAVLITVVFELIALLFSIATSAQQKHPGIVTGKVRNATGTPIASVSVTAYLGEETISVVTTDKAGVFSIPIKKNGLYSFEFSAKGYLTQQKGPYDVKAENGLSILMDMEPAKTASSLPDTTQPAGAVKVVKGIVLSSKTNVPVEGVSIAVDGQLYGATTKEGAYEITLSSKTKSVIFSHIGFEPLEMPVKQDYVNDFRVINLIPINKELEQVTVVAFGTQKKESVIASIATITPADLRRPTSNLTASLAGQVAGVIAYQRSGEPGRDNAEFFIRGISTFGTAGVQTPLILIDNVEMTARDLAILQPDDIASFSIMKDASAAALYGARGANGVLLVTTKKGKEGRPILSFRVENSLSMPTRKVQVSDPITFMQLHNEAVTTRNPLEAPPYTPAQIDNLRLGTNPYVYPMVNWQDMLIKKSTLNQRYNFNLSGGGKTARYYVSGSYNRDNGILKVDKRNNFNSNVLSSVIQVRSNIDINVTKTTQVSIKMNGTFDEYTGPPSGGSGVFMQTLNANPVRFPAYYPADSLHQYTNHILFGNVEGGTYLNPYAEMVKGYSNDSRTNLLSQFEIYQDLNSFTKGLKARMLINTSRVASYSLRRIYKPYYYIVDKYDPVKNSYSLKNVNPDAGQEFLSFEQGDKSISTSFYLESAINYDRTFNDRHSVGGMAVYYMRSASNANAGSLLASLPSRNIGISGRFTYNYDRRYFTEFNFGYNGSERFDPSHRFGFFPSFGLAWLASNEKFLQKISFLKTLKFRGTYGLNGSDAIGDATERFFYMSNVDFFAGFGPKFGLNWDFPNQTPTTSILRYANPNISWARARKVDVGMEVSLRNGLNLTADIFREDRTNILMDRAATTTEMGLEATIRSNVGKAYTKGAEGSVSYQHRVNNNLSLSGRGNFTYAVGYYKAYEEIDYSAVPWRYKVGRPITQTWGYVAERLFIDQQDIDNAPVQQFGGTYMPGDIKYADINGDGIIDVNDQVPIGLPTSPEIIYGFGFSAVYKRLDVGVFFQGSARSSFWINPRATAPFINSTGGAIGNNALLKVYEENHWAEDNQNIYALWPRLSAAEEPNNMQTSTWFMRNGSYLRFKNVDMGYTLSEKWLNRYSISNCRLYFSALNLLTISKFKLWDIEMGGNGLSYPVQRVYNIGLQLSFK